MVLSATAYLVQLVGPYLLIERPYTDDIESRAGGAGHQKYDRGPDLADLVAGGEKTSLHNYMKINKTSL